MPEPITTVGIGAIAAYIGKDGIQKLLGPTADYLGGGLKDFTEKRFENIGKIFKKADDKLGDDRDKPGSVPPKVLKTIINDGSYNDNDVAVEYFGGVLASARTELGRDDRGARIAKMVDELSTYQLRTHFLIYSTVKELFKNKGYKFGMEDRSKMEIFLPFPFYAQAMGYNQEEYDKAEVLLRHTFFGLQNDGLIDNDFQYGGKDHMSKIVKSAQYDGIMCQPSALGAELFLWAFGQGDKGLDYIFNNNFNPKIDDLPQIIPNTIAVKET
ncbi:hypothetical protein Q4506_01570 [Colwellia sp. 4_MG-2023]|uniref:hypothetical protein n=1 Tax=unclassified Colwellia TaxID=196834 RepID=UPI0026E2A074|nr:MULTISPECIES: hypothetical protein [unclassified Colwellia]MDO6505358.1 hypothetical protein [Colwellia sp. 5_MG-2023]MDO6554346.1 hypothetical protein [Colwellia sp. 4_MG-2023]